MTHFLGSCPTVSRLPDLADAQFIEILECTNVNLFKDTIMSYHVETQHRWPDLTKKKF